MPRHRREIANRGDRGIAALRRTAARRRSIGSRRPQRSTENPPARNRGRAAPARQRYRPFRSRTQRRSPSCSGSSSRRPVQFGGEIPLSELAELLAHEQQLLSGVRPHEAVIRPHRSPPAARGRPACGPGSSALPWTTSSWDSGRMKFSREGIEQAEGQLVVVPAPVHGFQRDIFQGVVHPPHVPLEAKAQARHCRLAAIRQARRWIPRRS